jgi:hypothetical protein
MRVRGIIVFETSKDCFSFDALFFWVSHLRDDSWKNSRNYVQPNLTYFIFKLLDLQRICPHKRWTVLCAYIISCMYAFNTAFIHFIMLDLFCIWCRYQYVTEFIYVILIYARSWHSRWWWQHLIDSDNDR